jgi:hypothetical protein
MQTFDVAHIKEQGVDLIIIPLDRSFQYKPDSEKHQAIAALQTAASSAGLAGTVVPVWDAGAGRTAFIAPQNWHAFFRGVGLAFVAGNINRRLTCNW